MNSAMRRSTRTASCSTTARSGSTGARWSRSGGANGYAGERWYTGGGLLEVGGYLATSGRTASEWLAQGGTATFTGGAGHPRRLGHQPVRRHAGRAGRYIRQSWLRGADGRLYDVSRAPATCSHRPAGLRAGAPALGRQGHAGLLQPLDRPRTRFENGYTVGRDAGALIVSTGRPGWTAASPARSTRARARPTRRNGTWTAICSRRRPWRAAAA